MSDLKPIDIQKRKKQSYKSEAIYTEERTEVDRLNDRIYDVVIIQEGICKNGDYISPAFLSDLTKLAEAQTQGVKARFGHPNMCSTTLGAYIGRWKNYRVIDDGKLKVIADLHFAEIAKKTMVEGRGISMYDYLMDMAEEEHDMFGTSIHYNCTEEPYVDEDGAQVYQDGWPVYEPTITEYYASDCVDHPAATENLFKNSDDLGIKVTNFLDDNPKIIELFKSDSNLIVNFFSKYFNSKNPQDMGLLQKLKKNIFGRTNDIDITLADGSMVTVVTENEVPAVGDPVVDSEGQPVPDGEHVDAEENVIVTEGGIITEIRPKVDEAEEEEEAEQSTDETVGEQLQQVMARLDSMEKNINEGIQINAENIELVAKAVDKNTKNHKTLAKTIKTDYKPTPNGQQKDLSDGKPETMYEKIQRQREEQEEGSAED